MEFAIPKLTNEGNDTLDIKIFLFENVTNIFDIQKRLKDEVLPVVFLGPQLIPSPFILQISALKAYQNSVANTLRSHNLYSEVLLNLSSNRSFSDAIKNFGFQRAEKVSVIVILFPSDTFKEEELKKLVVGEVSDLANLSNYFDAEKAKKVYGISNEELKISTIENAICSRIVTRDL